MLGASLSALLCGEGRGGEGRARGRDLTSLFFPFSLCAGARKHMSPLHSGQEDKRARKRKKERKKKEEKKQGGIGIWRRRRSWRVFFSETQREVEKKRGGLLPGWPSEKSSDSFFGLLGLTNQHTKAKSKKKRIQEWRVNRFTRRPQSWDALDAEPSSPPLLFRLLASEKLNYASTLLHRLICNTSHVIIPAL